MSRQSQPKGQGSMKTCPPRWEWGAMEGFGFSQLPLEADERGVSGKEAGWGAGVVRDGEEVRFWRGGQGKLRRLVDSGAMGEVIGERVAWWGLLPLLG